MSNVVRHPRIFLADGCLMVRADTTLKLLHAMAKSLRIPRTSFYRGASKTGSLPRYVLNPAQEQRCIKRFGPTGTMSQAVDACFRRRRHSDGRAATR